MSGLLNLENDTRGQTGFTIKPAFHDADTDILARILADTSDTRDFLKLFLWQAERHADVLATILARMSARKSVSVSAPWNASFRRIWPRSVTVERSRSLHPAVPATPAAV